MGLALSLSAAGWVATALFSEATSSLDAKGFLHEPLFWLIPVSYIFLFVAVVLAVLDVVRTLGKPR